MQEVLDNNIRPIPKGYVKIIDREHKFYARYGKVVKRGRISSSSKGFITVNVKLLGGDEDGEIIEFRDTQIEQTDLVHEAKVVNVAGN